MLSVIADIRLASCGASSSECDQLVRLARGVVEDAARDGTIPEWMEVQVSPRVVTECVPDAGTCSASVQFFRENLDTGDLVAVDEPEDRDEVDDVLDEVIDRIMEATTEHRARIASRTIDTALNVFVADVRRLREMLESSHMSHVDFVDGVRDLAEEFSRRVEESVL